mmetsp:Transcript_11205/g.18296  ORF Transcript_11205/g.18296 Transcript_11205/m.18296 type:complete len:670 (+) Transcript_11205:141-2150(+)
MKAGMTTLGLLVLAICPTVTHAFVAYAIESYNTGYILRTVNAGRNWTNVQTTFNSLEAVGFRGDMRVHAVGDGGALWKAMLANNRTEFCDPMNAEDCRSPWTYPPGNFSAVKTGTTNDLTFCEFFNDNIGIIGGKLGQIFQTRNGGADWTKIDTGRILDLNDVAISEKTGRGLAVGRQGYSLSSNDWGWHWTLIPSLLDKHFNFNAASLNHNGTNSVIVGANGVIQVSVDNMTSYRPANFSGAGTIFLRDYELLSVEFFDEVTAIATGTGCLVLMSYDGGINWVQKKITCLDKSDTVLYDVSVCEEGYGVIAARDHFYYTNDTGETWEMSPQQHHLDVNHITDVQMMCAAVFWTNHTLLKQDNFTELETTYVRIEFTNIGSKPLWLEEVNITSACKCVTMHPASTEYYDPIQPNEKGVVIISYGTDGYTPGTYEARVNIYHNGPTRVQRVDIELRLQHEVIYIALTFLQKYWLALMLIMIITLIAIYFRIKMFLNARRKREYNRWKLKAYRKVAREEIFCHCCVVYGCDFIGYFHASHHSWVYETSHKRAMDMDSDSEKERSSDDEDISEVSSVSSDEDLESIVDRVDPLDDVTDETPTDTNTDSDDRKDADSDDSDSSSTTSSSDPIEDVEKERERRRKNEAEKKRKGVVAERITSSEDSDTASSSTV